MGGRRVDDRKKGPTILQVRGMRADDECWGNQRETGTRDKRREREIRKCHKNLTGEAPGDRTVISGDLFRELENYP